MDQIHEVLTALFTSVPAEGETQTGSSVWLFDAEGGTADSIIRNHHNKNKNIRKQPQLPADVIQSLLIQF